MIGGGVLDPPAPAREPLAPAIPERPGAGRGSRALPLAAGLLAVGLACYGLAGPGGLHGVIQYDDGTYFGAAVRLLQGQLPYKDFVFVQPPGITLLLAPLAALARGVGTREGLALARILTGCVAGLDAYLAGRLLAHRGRVAGLVAALALAVQPVAFFADRTLLLEPYLVGLCLGAARLAFSGDGLAGTCRLLAAGALLGLAGTVKSWAVVPAAALVLCTLLAPGGPSGAGRPARRGRWRAAASVTGGVAAGFVVPCLPFFAFAPGAFVHEVVLAQLGRTAGSSPLVSRLPPLVGLTGIEGVDPKRSLGAVLAVLLGGALLAGVAVPALRGRGGALERFVVLAGAGAVAAVLVPAQFFYHYVYFAAGFSALMLGSLAGRAAAGAGRLVRAGPGPGRVRAGAAGALAALALVAGLAWLVPNEARFDAAASVGAGDPALAIDLAVPAGACAVSDAAILLVEADRFSSDRPGCPDVVDATGTWLTVSPRLPARGCGPVDPALVARWRGWFARADYFVESGEAGLRIPWTRALRAFFLARYARVPDPGAVVYVRRDLAGAGALLDPARWTRRRLAAEGYLARPRRVALPDPGAHPRCLVRPASGG